MKYLSYIFRMLFRRRSRGGELTRFYISRL